MDQSELDKLMQETALPTDAGDKAGDELGWDDEKEELEAASKKAPKAEVSEVHFGEIKNAAHERDSLDLDFILDIPLTLTVELGRCQLLISEMLQLGQGSVVELTKLAGEPTDIFVNQRLIARGEVVVVNEKFGVRLTDIVSPAERVNKLR
ncbi:MAG TPA: flagellar motor switch protein FliN [Syntrophales bacterium]|nr:flagellar motor switch protein FliN [Syntrophales bacterium]